MTRPCVRVLSAAILSSPLRIECCGAAANQGVPPRSHVASFSSSSPPQAPAPVSNYARLTLGHAPHDRILSSGTAMSVGVERRAFVVPPAH